jgi:hypothetical protein
MLADAAVMVAEPGEAGCRLPGVDRGAVREDKGARGAVADEGVRVDGGGIEAVGGEEELVLTAVSLSS